MDGLIDSALNDGRTTRENLDEVEVARENRGYRSSVMRRILACLIGIVAAVLIGECFVRVAGLGNAAISKGPLHQHHPLLGWTCLPSSSVFFEQPGSFRVEVSTNSSGFRGRMGTSGSEEDVRKILCLGDSTMWGYGVSDRETFSQFLEGIVPSSEVVSLGVNGYSTVQELLAYELFGNNYQNTDVILAFCSNDLGDNMDSKRGGRPYATLSPEGELVIKNSPVQREWKSPFKQALRHHSRLFACLEYTGKLLQIKWSEGREREASGDDAGVVEAATDDDDVGYRELYSGKGAKLSYAWDIQRELIRALNVLVRSKEATLHVVYVPDPTCVLPEMFEVVQEGCKQILDWDAPEARLKQVCEELDVNYIDILGSFRGSKHAENLFLKKNSHWGPKGHQLAAEVVGQHLLKDS